jgi:hypothetical protein
MQHLLPCDWFPVFRENQLRAGITNTATATATVTVTSHGHGHGPGERVVLKVSCHRDHLHHQSLYIYDDNVEYVEYNASSGVVRGSRDVVSYDNVE